MTTAAAQITIVHRDLPASRGPHIENSYRPKNIKKPGGIPEWAGVVRRLARSVERLARFGRRLRNMHREMEGLTPGEYLHQQLDQERDAFIKRTVQGCQELAFVFLETGVGREHLGDFLNHCGMRDNDMPDYGIPLLYSKLMGLEFAEDRTIEHANEEGEVVVDHETEHKRYTWAVKLSPAQIEDFAATMEKLQAGLEELQGRFARGEVRVAYLPQ